MWNMPGMPFLKLKALPVPHLSSCCLTKILLRIVSKSKLLLFLNHKKETCFCGCQRSVFVDFFISACLLYLPVLNLNDPLLPRILSRQCLRVVSHTISFFLVDQTETSTPDMEIIASEQVSVKFKVLYLCAEHCTVF